MLVSIGGQNQVEVGPIPEEPVAKAYTCCMPVKSRCDRLLSPP